MGWIDARLNVAFVTSKKIILNWTKLIFPKISMNEKCFSSKYDLPIPFSFRTSPNPTPIFLFSNKPWDSFFKSFTFRSVIAICATFARRRLLHFSANKTGNNSFSIFPNFEKIASSAKRRLSIFSSRLTAFNTRGILPRFTFKFHWLIILFIPTICLAGDIVVSQFGGLNSQDPTPELQPYESQDLLNVTLCPGGKCVQKRDGYGLFANLPINTSTTAAHGGYHFQQTGGNDVQLWGNDIELSGSVSDGAFVKLATGTLGATWQCADSQGFAYCLTSSHDTCVKTDGTSANTSFQGSVPLGTMVAFTPLQMVVAGVSANPSTLYISAQNNFTNFTTGPNNQDSLTEIIAAPGSRITHIAYYFGKLFWWKDQSFGFVSFSNQYDLTVTIVSNQIGTLDNSDAYWNSGGYDTGNQFSGATNASNGEIQGGIYFRGQDNHIYRFDGYFLTRVSRIITPTVTAANRRKANAWTQTSQTDFAGGGVTFNGPSVSVSTASTPGDVIPSSITLLDNTNALFNTDTIGSGIDTTTVSNAFTLKTYANEPFSSSLSNWTQTNGNFTVASGFLDYTQSASKMKYSTSPNPVSDFILQVDFNLNGVCNNAANEIGVVNGSGNAYGIAAETSGGKASLCILKVPLWDDGSGTNNSTVACGTQMSTCDSNWHTLVLLRTASSGAMTLSEDGTQITSVTDTSYSNFVDLKVSAEGATGVARTHARNLYLTARSGNVTSRVFDTAFSTPVYGAFQTTTNGSGTNTYSIRCSSNSLNTFTSESSISSGSNITGCTQKRYIVYSSTISATSPTSLPQVSTVSIFAVSTGTYYSAVNNAPNLTAWGTLGITDSQPGNSTISYFTRSSTNSFSVLSSTPSWVSQTKNSTVSSSTGTYFQLRADFNVTAATEVPDLSDFTFNWFEGTSGDKAYMTYFNDAIWISESTGTATSYNDIVLYYDLLNQAWLVFSIPSNGFLIENNALYFGDPVQGRIFKFGGVTTDNAVAINAYWKSKDFLGQDPFVQNEFVQADFVVKSASPTVVTYTYTLDTKTATAVNLNLFDSASTYIRRAQLLGIGKIGSYYNFKVGDNSGNPAWTLMAHRVKYNPLNWRPVP